MTEPDKLNPGEVLYLVEPDFHINSFALCQYVAVAEQWVTNWNFCHCGGEVKTFRYDPKLMKRQKLEAIAAYRAKLADEREDERRGFEASFEALNACPLP